MQAVLKGIGRSVGMEALRSRFDGVGPRLLANLFVAVFVLLTVVFFIERDVKNRQSAKEGEDLRSFLEMTTGMLDAMNAQVERGEVPLADAQAAAIAVLEEMRFRGDGYFFVFDDAMMIIAHGGNGGLVGVSAADMKDPEGAFVYRELLNVSRAGTGIVEYLWTKPGSEGAWPKLGAAVPFAEWGWHIGTGVYTDNLAKQIAAMRMGALMIVVPGVIVLLLIATLISLSITRPIKALSSRMNALSDGDAATDVPGTDRGGEVGEMARSIDAFRTVYTEASQAETREAERRASEMQSQKRVVEELGSKLHAMSEGDLSQRIVVEFEGEYDRLRVDFNNAVDRLRSAIGSVVVNSSN
ncbi:MAG: cache domain-containing protein, partial [Pseudomonadota bacterium]